MNLNSLLVLIIIYLIMLTCNLLAPLFYGDDYLYSFIITKDTIFLHVVYESLERVDSFCDIITSQWNHYFIWGGRTIAHILLQFFLWQGKLLFDFFNAFVFVLLGLEIYWIVNRGNVSLNFKPSRLCWIFFALWTMTPSFPVVYLWLTAVCNYLWMMVLSLAFALIYVRKYFKLTSNILSDKVKSFLMLPFGIISGWTNENNICWLILIIAIMIYQSYRKRDIKTWMITGWIGLCIGYTILIFAPGNMERLAIGISFGLVTDFKSRISNALMMILAGLFFELILWHFFLRTIYKQAKFGDSEDIKRSIIMAKVFAIISAASTLIMIFSPEFTGRSLFQGFIYLLIAVTILIRLQHETGKNQMNKSARKFLHVVAIALFSITLCSTVMGLSSLRQYADYVSKAAMQEHLKPTNKIIEVPKFEYLDWISNACIFHLPIGSFDEDENDWHNVVYSRYYGIKGIHLNPNLTIKDWLFK